MSDAEKIDHANGCLKEIRRLADFLQTCDEEKKNGYARKIHQLAGYCLDRIQSGAKPTATPRANHIHSSEMRARVLAHREKKAAAKAKLEAGPKHENDVPDGGSA